jgi:hypothetical protein
LTPEEQRLDRLADRLRVVDPIIASPGAKIRGWNLVLAAVEQSATVRSRTHPVRRLVVAAVIVVALLVVGAFAASADSLPDSPVYPLKGVLDNARGWLAFSPSDKFAYHLDLARTRLTEADAMIARHRLDLAGRALNGFDDQITATAQVVQAEQRTDPTVAADMENRLGRAIATQDAHLQDLQGQVTNPAAVDAISRARDRAAKAIPSAKPSH